MLERFLEASVPSLFAVLEPLYRDEAKVAVIERHLQEARRREHRHAEALSLLEAQHVFRRSGDRERALAILERHPESLECHEARARLLYASGAYRPAYEAADAARRLDLRDRAINSLTVEYALRAGEIERATELIAAFTHDGELPTNQALYNLQVISPVHARALCARGVWRGAVLLCSAGGRRGGAATAGAAATDGIRQPPGWVGGAQAGQEGGIGGVGRGRSRRRAAGAGGGPAAGGTAAADDSVAAVAGGHAGAEVGAGAVAGGGVAAGEVGAGAARGVHGVRGGAGDGGADARGVGDVTPAAASVG
eukprot:ctg_954.g331